MELDLDKTLACVIYNTLKYKSTADLALNFANDIFTLDAERIEAETFEWVLLRSLERQMDEIFDYLADSGTSATGYLIVTNKSEGVITQSKYTFGSKGIHCELGCEIKITTKKPSTDEDGTSPKLTLEEKLKLVEKFWKEFSRRPDDKEVYENFKIGGFVKKSVKDADTLEQLKKIIVVGL
jgi:hypothetical protein